jgi:biopolymer transport protein ExbD
MPKLEPMQQPPSRTGGRRARVMRVSTSLAEINVVPLIDVMLVLLVVFMVAAPMMQQGFAVQLPESRQSKSISEPVTITVPASFRKDRRVRLGDEAVGIDVLSERVRQALSGQLQQNVILAGDGAVTLSELVTVFDSLLAGGVDRVSIQTQPVTGRMP